jgi:hypothetical protein
MDMRIIALSLAFGALAVSGVFPANADSVQPQRMAVETETAVQSTEMSARHRGWHRPYRALRVYPRYYYPPPYYYYYPSPGPVVNLGYGFRGGPRFYASRNHYRFWGVGY